MKKLLVLFLLFLTSCYKEETILTCATYVIFYNDNYTDTIRVTTVDYLHDDGKSVYTFNRSFFQPGSNIVYNGTAPYKRIHFSQRVIND